MCPPTSSVRPSGSRTWPAQKRLRPYGTGRNVSVAGFQSRSELSAGAEPVEHEHVPVGVERHVHGDDRPRDRVRSTRRRRPAGRRPRRATSRRAGRARAGRRRTTSAARCHDDESSPEPVRVSRSRPHGQDPALEPVQRLLSRVGRSRDNDPKSRVHLAVRRGSRRRADASAPRTGPAGPARRPAPARARAPREREPVGRHRHEHQLEPEGAEERRRKDVQERRDRPREHQVRGHVADRPAASARRAGAATPPTR